MSVVPFCKLPNNSLFYGHLGFCLPFHCSVGICAVSISELLWILLWMLKSCVDMHFIYLGYTCLWSNLLGHKVILWEIARRFSPTALLFFMSPIGNILLFNSFLGSYTLLCMSVLTLYTYVPDVSFWCLQSSKSESGALELELQMILISHLVAGKLSQILGKIIKCS